MALSWCHYVWTCNLKGLFWRFLFWDDGNILIELWHLHNLKFWNSICVLRMRSSYSLKIISMQKWGCSLRSSNGSGFGMWYFFWSFWWRSTHRSSWSQAGLDISTEELREVKWQKVWQSLGRTSIQVSRHSSVSFLPFQGSLLSLTLWGLIWWAPGHILGVELPGCVVGMWV